MNEQDLSRVEKIAEKGHRLKELFNNSGDPTVRLRRKLLFQAAAAVCVCMIIAAAAFGITAAWYTNVVKSESLSVSAEAWGFRGTVTVGDTEIVAAPGETGILDQVQIQNESEKPVRIRLDVDKSGTPEELQKRFYFYYVDPETEQRVWINSRQGYIFRMEGSTPATMDQVHWMWVYDLLGYYALCSYDPESGTLVEEEFLQPVEYELDSAQFDENGLLLNAETMIPAGSRAVPGYQGRYVVELLENEGKAIVLRLLSRTEIQDAIDYDTGLAYPGQEPTVRFIPVLRFTGENIKAQESTGGNTGGDTGA